MKSNDVKNKGKKDKKNIKNKKGKKKIVAKIFLILLIAIIAAGIYFVYKVQQNGGGAQGIVATMLGTDMTKKKDMPKINVLLLGASQNLTDTIMVASYDPNSQTASLMSIPRDTFVGRSKSRATASDKINSLYQYGPERTLKAVNDITGLDIKYYLAVDTKALRELVDAIGGVTFNVPIDMKYTDTSQKLYIDLKAGEQVLDGNKAEQVVRFRHNDDGSSYPVSYGDNDLGRMKTQRDFLIAVAKQTLKPSNILKLTELVDIAKNNVTTNLEFDVIKDYIPHMVEFSTENITTGALPGTPEKCNGVWLFIRDKTESQKLIDQLFLSNYAEVEDSSTTEEEEVAETEKIEYTTAQKEENEKVTVKIINGSGSDDKAKKLAKELKEDGFTLEDTEDSSTVIKTVIINRNDITNEMMERLKSSVGRGSITVGNKSEKVDVTILLGQDYK